MQFHKAIFYFNPKMGHMLDLAIVVANSALPCAQVTVDGTGPVGGEEEVRWMR